MGTVYAEITLKNAADVANVESGLIKEQDVHEMTEDMDLIVNPARRELTGAHGDNVVCLVK
jgi:hypothetical protein